MRLSVEFLIFVKKKTSDQPFFPELEDVRRQRSGNYYHHTHAVFAYKDGIKHCMAAGHMKSITVLYTAEIELRPVTGGTIKRKYDPETGTGFWDFEERSK